MTELVKLAHRRPDSTMPGFSANVQTIWFMVSASVLAVFIPTMLLANIEDAGRSGAWVVTLAICCWSGVRISWIISLGVPKIFEFMFWLFVYIFFGLAATVQIRGDTVPATTPGVPIQLYWTTVLLIAGSLWAFELGRLCPGRSRETAGLVQAPSAGVITSDGLNPVAVWSLAILGGGANILYIRQQGLASFFENRTDLAVLKAENATDASAGFLLGALAWIPLLVAAGAFVWLRRERKRRGLSGRYGLVILLCAALVLIVVNPISGARFTSGTVLFALITYMGIFSTPRRARLSFAGVVAGFIFVFPIADAFRTSTVNVSRPGFFLEYAGNGDYDSIWQVSNSLLYVHDQGSTYGRQVLGVLLFFVPRSVWPSKPLDTGVLLANFRGYSFTNLSSPLWAEAVINGGAIFAVVVFFLLGIVIVRIDRGMPTAFTFGGRRAVIGAVLPAYSIILLRGSLLQASGGFALMLLSFLLIGLGAHRSGTPLPPAADGPDPNEFMIPTVV